MRCQDPNRIGEIVIFAPEATKNRSNVMLSVALFILFEGESGRARRLPPLAP